MNGTLNADGTMNYNGRVYKTVGLRVNEFRENFRAKDGWGIRTTMQECTSDSVLFVAEIVDPQNRVVATGHSHETWEGEINKTSAVEVCETSAIGRALAACGFAGSEYASANEVVRAKEQQAAGKTNQPKPAPKPESKKEEPKPAGIPADGNLGPWIEGFKNPQMFRNAIEPILAIEDDTKRVQGMKLLSAIYHTRLATHKGRKSAAINDITDKIQLALTLAEQKELEQQGKETFGN